MDSAAREEYNRYDISSKIEDTSALESVKTHIASDIVLNTDISEKQVPKPAVRKNRKSDEQKELESDGLEFCPNDHNKIIPINVRDCCYKSPRAPQLPQFFYAQKHKPNPDESSAPIYCSKSPILASQKHKFETSTVGHCMKTKELQKKVNHDDTACCTNIHCMATPDQILHYRIHRKNNINMAPKFESLKDKGRLRVLVKKRRKSEKDPNIESQNLSKNQLPTQISSEKLDVHEENSEERQQYNSSPNRSSPTKLNPATKTPPNSLQSSSRNDNLSVNQPNSKLNSKPSSRPGSRLDTPRSFDQHSIKEGIPEDHLEATSLDAPQNPTDTTLLSPQETSRRPSAQSNPAYNLKQQYVTSNSKQPSITSDQVRQPLTSDQGRQQPITSDQGRQQPLTSDQVKQQSLASDQGKQQSLTSDQVRQQSLASDQVKQQFLTSDQEKQQSYTSDQEKQDRSAETEDPETSSSPNSKDTTNAVIYGRGFGFLPDRTIVSSRAVSQTRSLPRSKSGSFHKSIMDRLETEFNE